MFSSGIPPQWLGLFNLKSLENFNLDPDAPIAKSGLNTNPSVTHALTLAELLGEEECPESSPSSSPPQ